MEFLGQALRQVVFLLDQVAYGLIPSAYELIFYLANINLATNDIFISIINRIYLLLGIFMLFKVSFSIMQYIVDPNSFSDSSKGFGKLVTNALVSVVLLALVPFVFEQAYELQSKVVLSNVIPNLILGEKLDDYSSSTADTDKLKQQRKDIRSLAVDTQFTIFSAFYNLNTNANGGYPSCDPGTTGKPLSNVIGSSDMVNNDECWNAVKTDLENEIHKQGGTLKGLFKYCTDDKCNEIKDERDFGTFKYLLWWMKDGGSNGFTINYIPIVSAIVGAYLLLLLVTFAIDIATRLFRLMFLQAVAPIAIISYIDPKESIGKSRLRNWGMECLKVYVSLFLRLAVIYLAIQLIKLITSVVFAAFTDAESLYYDGLAPEGTLNIFVYIILILGIFTFAKKLPEMIERIFNIKLSGELHLNPFKNQAFASAAAVGLAGAGAMAANALAAPGRLRNLQNKWRQGGGLAGAGKRLKESVNEALMKPYEPFGFNDGVDSRRNDLRAAREIRRNLREEHAAGRISDADYARRKANVDRAIVDNKMGIAQEKAERAKSRKEAKTELRDSFSQIGKDAANIARHYTEPAATVAGIAAAGAAAGARAAGSKPASPSDIASAAKKAREASNAAREERNSRADMAREGRYSAMDRARDTINKFSGVKGDKSYGVGQIGDQINALKSEIANMERRRLRANEMVTEALSKRSGISDTQLRGLFDQLVSAKPSEMGGIVNNITNQITHVNSADQAIANQYLDAVKTAQGLTDQQIAMQRELKQLQDVTNLSNPKSDKK